MGTIVTHIAKCDYCGKTEIMQSINTHVPNAGYALPKYWNKLAWGSDCLICPECTMKEDVTVRIAPYSTEWIETTAYRCKHCKNLFEDKLMQCPWCGAEMSNGDTNYR
jgi:hypothetical protein